MTVEGNDERVERIIETEYDRLVWRAILIAKDLASCEALIRGERVPAERLDFAQVRRFGRR